MKARRGLRGPPTRKLWVVIGLIVALVVVIALIIKVVLSNGTGFDGYIKVTTAHIISGPSRGTVTRTEEYQSGKALWDWLQLLIIPLVLAAGALLFNLATTRTEQKIALDNQREVALKEYIDQISELLLKEHLGELKPEYENVRKIARVRTLTVLRRLDANRKRSVLQFLYESGLIYKGKLIIDLSGADLSGADLREAFLNGIHLYNVDLRRANMSQAHFGYVPQVEQIGLEYIDAADLSRANLSEANLSKADLERVTLSYANLTKANLSGTDLQEGADLSHANLTRANLSYAKLINADLSDADLTGADLTNTELSLSTEWDENVLGADLSKAKLKGVTGISIEELEKKAASLKGAIMPNGDIHS